MTSPIPDDPFPPEQTEEPPPPFENAITFQITKQVNLTQLTDEIDHAVGLSVNIALSWGPEADPSIPPSDTNPVTLSVSPGTVDQAKVEQVIENHQPITGYDIPEAEREFAAVTQKVVDDELAELTPEEIQTAVRGLLRRAAMVAAPDSHRSQLV